MPDLLSRQSDCSGKQSCGLQEFQCLFAANHIKALPRDAKGVSSFFANTSSRRMRVPVTPRLYSWAATHAPDCARSLVAMDGSFLASRLTAILSKPPFDHHTLLPHDPAWGDLAAMAAATMFLDTVLDALNQCSGSSVAYSLILNRGHTGGSSGSSDGGTKSRPDMLLAVNSCTVVLGHFSHNQDMMPGAVAELVGKLGAMDSHQYRPLPYIFGITGVGSQLQLHILSAKLGRLQIEPVTPCIDVAHLSGRIHLVLVLSKLHSLLLLMGKSLPQRFGRSCHFSRTITRPGMVLEFLPHAVRKSVCNFTAYTAQNHTSLEAIIAAHRVAREAAQEAKSRKTRQVLTVSESDPCLMFDTYTTTTGPIGTLAEPTDPEDLRSLAYTCCKAAAILHETGLVYRDWKLCNLVKLPATGTWMVIDLELVAFSRHSLVPLSYTLVEWTRDTCSSSGGGDEPPGMVRYTEASDMHQIGVLLKKCAEHLVATVTSEERAGYEDALRFTRELLSKRLTAAAALEHDYLRPLANT